MTVFRASVGTLLHRLKPFLWVSVLTVALASLVPSLWLIFFVKVPKLTQVCPEPQLTQTESFTSSASAEITVSVVGAVQRPGSYVLPANSRVESLLSVAGGVATGSADPYFYRQIHLAEKLRDGQQIEVPFPSPFFLELTENSQKSGLISLNSATSSELQKLPSIGKAKADLIIKSRPILSWDELKSVLKINDQIVESLQKIAEL